MRQRELLRQIEDKQKKLIRKLVNAFVFVYFRRHLHVTTLKVIHQHRLR